MRIFKSTKEIEKIKRKLEEHANYIYDQRSEIDKLKSENKEIREKLDLLLKHLDLKFIDTVPEGICISQSDADFFGLKYGRLEKIKRCQMCKQEVR